MSASESTTAKAIAITQGDCAGIGPEILAKAFKAAPQAMRGCFVVGELQTLRRATASAALPTGVMGWEEVVRRRPGARPFSAAAGDTASSPPPPARGAWRRR